MSSSSSRSVALVVDYLYDFQVKVLRGIHLGLDRAGLASVTFVGRDLHPVDTTYQKANDVYRLIAPERYQGVIFSAASLGNSVSEKEIQAFAAQFSAVPGVAISRPVGHLPAVLVDNAAGMRELMEHLIVTLGCRRFVHVQGMAGNPESELREKVVRETLNHHGLTLKPEHVLRGDFFGPKAAQEMTRLLQTDRDFEVVVCANDEMALGVMRALGEQGIDVPTEVAVVGFDDIEAAQQASPALTTVRQPVVETGEKAVDLLLQQHQKQQGPELLLLPAHLVVRKSCGALPESLLQRHWTAPDLREHAQLVQAYHLAAHEPLKRMAFLQIWQKTLKLDLSAEALRGLLFALEQQGRAFGVDPGHLYELTFLGLHMLAEHQQTPAAGQYLGLSRTNQMSTRSELSLTSHNQMESFRADIPRYLEGRGVKRYALVLFEQGTSQICAQASLFSASMLGAVENEVFSTSQLLPAGLQHELQHGHLLVVPLFLNDLHHGLLIFEKPEDDHFDVEHLRFTLSSAIHHVRSAMVQQAYTHTLEQQVKERTRELENEIAVRLRAEKALRIANQELQQSALTDALTGIFNRAAFDTYLQREWINHQIARQPLSILLCDVDFFKQYNDLYGHLQGDDCLKRIARALDSSGRNRSDFTARYGGEEFVMVLSSTNAAGARIVAERLCAAVRQLEIPHQGSRVHPHVTVSIGVATVVPCSDLNPDQVVDWADQALYQAKQQGRNRSLAFEGEEGASQMGAVD
ncbi:diguanylate cyclase domain-containing protein [Deinococcus cellulosilyticus]|uniref:GGDEF domain-containing protein n=1 Tax=Deinococcus cellulosilyticus (strain DSM 18568 / NBRC 106333 / KACC 11606 / 5516J-15) TaxID=1223518 RepID=A0A511MWG7_DEIC1|nr:diguanylate cyclase [Deinococcus cellulosilyticus]GEM44608.1 hypothetical protein DC3_02430 [Deinococcus cellulosilyticus NBRC 106333 = KACC 11606]